MKYAVVLDIDDDIFKNYHNIGIDYQIKGISNDTDNDIYDVLDSQEIYPIKELPQQRILPKEETEGTEYGVDPWFSDGWNECLTKICE